MSFPLRIAVAFVFAFSQFVAGAEDCIWCNKKTENDFLDCVSKKISRNRELNIPPDIVQAMVRSLKAASRVINTPDNIKSEIMKGAFAGEVLGMVVSIKSPGRNTNSVVSSVMGSIEECYIAVTGQSGTKFSSSINRAVTNLMLDEDAGSNSNEYSLAPETGFGSSNDYPNPPPVVENSPRLSPNQVFPVIQPQKNLGPSQQIPFQSLPPSAESVATSSFPKTREFVPNARQNTDNRAPFQPIHRQDFSSPGSYDSASANAPQNRDTYVPFQRRDFPPSGSFASSSANAPQNGDSYEPFQRQDFPPSGSFASSNANSPQIVDNYAPFQRQDFPSSGNFASSSANAPQNGDNYAPFQRQDLPLSGSFASSSANAPQNGDNYVPFQRSDFPPSGSFASSSANAPQNGDNYAPFQRQDFPPSGSFASSNANAPRNGDNYAPFQRNPPVSDSYASSNSNVGPNGDNYTPFQRQDILAPNSYAPSSSKIRQNEDNYAPNNNGKPFLGKNRQLTPHSPVIPQNPLQSAPIIPESNQPPFVPFPGPGVDSKGPYNSDGIYPNDQSINPPIPSPVERNANKSPQESNAGASSQTSVGRNNNAFQDYPNYAETNAYKGENIGPNEYYNDYGNNRWVPNEQPIYDLIPQDNDYNPINSQASGINSDGYQPQTTQNFPGSFPLQTNLSPNYQPLNGQSEYQNSDNQFVAPASFAVANSDDSGSGVGPPESSEGALTLQQAPKQEYNDQQNGPSSIEVPQSGDTSFGKGQPTSNEGTSALEQNNFNEGPQTKSNRQANIPTNDDWVPQNGINSEDTAAQMTTVATTQAPTTPATTEAPATPNPNVNSKKSCAMEFAEAIFVHLSENDSFNCVFNEDTTHGKAVSVAADAIQNAFSNAGLPDHANEAKRYCKRQFSQLSPGETSQKYAEKISKSAMIVVYKNDLLDRNCKAAGTFMAKQIMNAVSDISGSLNGDDNEQDKEPSENENKNPSQSNNTPISSSAATATASEGGAPDNYNEPQLNNVQDTESAGALAASQAPEEGSPINKYLQNGFPRRPWNKNRRRGRYPGISDNNAPNDATSGASSNGKTPVSPQNSDSGSPDYYNYPQSNNAPSSASAAASEGEAPDYYNEPQPNNVQDAGSLAASQVPEEEAPVNKYPQNGFPRRSRNKNRRRGGYPGISDNNAPDYESSGANSNGKTPVSPQNSDSGSPDYYNYPQSNNAPSSASAGASEGEVPGNYYEPQPTNVQDTGSAGSLDASQAPEEGDPVNKYPPGGFPRRLWIKNIRRVRYPGISDINAQDDASNGAISNGETPISPENSDSGSPDYYNYPQSNNAPSSASAGASEGAAPDYYNEPQPNNVQDAGLLAASQTPEEGAPVNKYLPVGFPRRPWNKNRRLGRYPGISDNNAPDDEASGASSNGKTPVSPQNSDSGSPDYYNYPQSNNAPSSASAAASEGEAPDYYNEPQPNNVQDAGSLAASQVPEEEAPVNKYPQNGFPRRSRNKNRRRGGFPGISDNNAPDDESSGASSNGETPVSPQNSDSGSPDYYNYPQSNNAPSSASAAASEGEAPDYYNEPQPNNVQDTGSAGSLATSQAPEEGAPVNKYPPGGFPRRPWNKNRRRGGYPGISDNNAPDYESSGANSNGETPVSPQNSDSGSPDYYNSPQSNNAPSSASAAAATISQDSNGGNSNNYDNNAPNIPAYNDQPPVESNPDKSGSLNSKKNPLLNELKDPDSKNHIEHLMKTALNCVSPDGFNYKRFTVELASVATAMKKERPDKSPGAILDKAFMAAIVALTQDLQNAMFDRQGNNGPQSTQDSQPTPNFYRSNSDSVGYEPSTNYQNSESSAVAVANSQSSPIGYQNVGNYQNTFQAEPLYRNPLQTNMNPSLQNIGQNSWDVTNTGNNLLNADPGDLPPNFGYNQNGGFAYAAAG